MAKITNENLETIALSYGLKLGIGNPYLTPGNDTSSTYKGTPWSKKALAWQQKNEPSGKETAKTPAAAEATVSKVERGKLLSEARQQAAAMFESLAGTDEERAGAIKKLTGVLGAAGYGRFATAVQSAFTAAAKDQKFSVTELLNMFSAMIQEYRSGLNGLGEDLASAHVRVKSLQDRAASLGRVQTRIVNELDSIAERFESVVDTFRLDVPDDLMDQIRHGRLRIKGTVIDLQAFLLNLVFIKSLKVVSVAKGEQFNISGMFASLLSQSEAEPVKTMVGLTIVEDANHSYTVKEGDVVFRAGVPGVAGDGLAIGAQVALVKGDYVIHRNALSLAPSIPAFLKVGGAAFAMGYNNIVTSLLPLISERILAPLGLGNAGADIA